MVVGNVGDRLSNMLVVFSRMKGVGTDFKVRL